MTLTIPEYLSKLPCRSIGCITAIIEFSFPKSVRNSCGHPTMNIAMKMHSNIYLSLPAHSPESNVELFRDCYLSVQHATHYSSVQ